VARKTPIPRQEIEIGRRITSAREWRLISQTALAVSIDIGRERLAKYESGLVPLPFWPGYYLCERLRLNQGWLATGKGPQEPFIQIPSDARAKLFEQVPKRALFSQVYRTTIRPLIEAETFLELAISDLQGSPSDSSFEEMYSMIFLSKLRQVSLSARRRFSLELAGAADEISRRLSRT
jgi:hypothetical protein